MEGWIKSHRRILYSEVFKNPYLLKVWVWCLHKASSKPYDAIVGLQTVHLEEGQFVFGLIKASEELGIPKSSLDRYLKKLEKMGKVEIKHTTKYSVLTVVNWGFYQGSGSDKSENVGIKWESNGNIQEGKENNNKKPYGEFKNVYLTDIELKKLKEKFPQDYKDRIETLSAYKKSKGKRYKSDYATILNWARKEAKEQTESKKGVEKIVW